MPPFRVLKLTGSHFAMGYVHGEAYAEEIRIIAEERIQLSTDPTWTGRSYSRKHVLKLAEESLPHHEAYSPKLMEQLRGMSAATGLTLPELIIANGFTDFVDLVYNSVEAEPEIAVYGNECTSWLAGGDITADGKGILAQNWDMHATATPHVVILHGQPTDELEFYALSLTGCVAMIGMNSAGITVGINNLVGADGQKGVVWPFVCRKILMQDNLEDALACISEAPLMGGHNYLLMDANGCGYNVEAMASKQVITPLETGALAHANACLHPDTQAVQRPLSEELIEDSFLRVQRAQTHLQQKRDLTVQDMIALQRNREDGAYSVCSMAEAPFFSETCAAIVMKPASRELWACWGRPNQGEYEHFQLPMN